MEPGEKEMRKAFEEVTSNNVKTGIEYTKETRAILRELEEQVQRLQNRVTAQEETIKQFKIQLAGVQTKLFSGGSN